ncbi:Gfo/Idh/MocA family oxidoreductase [Frankia sp. CNm7]|uniref:Gfo/Idh/MocA family oxidoreductase n=1 Tax=Frankia nepalensis TaxID=1836974 RepID=A0A937RJY7_9ACTN|nr:Gfo/Idh/MocA family oxidoreductase [Frankia nepalensis]MBL7501147.1 Gfo/Idh/MocA family oxidoreductase [Frankia nepalensis]MBL7513753.1 Gfo/Idh/MocA family oxidoreductase [Frankia nepalensis]MBL7521092.1 Gfo/Idh/MocA family oxidoreductase [Frankia nepalensis]MBL7631647.1 Gfo/Idh/MocA family oxidoreductase [Frankia nepalensis]
MPRIHLVSNLPGVSALGDHLRAAGLGPTSARSADALLVLIDRPLDSVEQELLDRARQSVPVLLAGPTVRALPAESPLVEASGFIPGRATPPHELRLVAGPNGDQVAARMGDFRPVDSWVVPDKVADDIERLLLVRHEMSEYPVCTWRPATGLGMFTLGSTAETLADPAYHRLVGRWLRHALGARDAGPVGVGLLGTPPAVAAHQAAVEATEGLDLVAVSGAGRSAGRGGDTAVRGYEEPDELLADGDVRLVVVGTSNQTRAQWASRALEAGKDVVIASPFALSTQETDDLALLAAARSSLLAMYPERREDPAYRCLRAAVRGGAVGDILSVEVTHGAPRRPEGGWRDDERASGGLIHDRGFGHLDWVLDLVDEPVEWVTATTHKRVWHHVTNADHARVLLRFASGAEAQITISDLLAVPTARLQVLGTAGALFGDDPATAALAAESEPEPARRGGRHAGQAGEGAPTVPLSAGPLTVVRHDGTRTRLPLPTGGGHQFYRDLADALLSGWPLNAYRVEAARRVVAVAEAATRSASAGGVQIGPA